MRLLFVEDDKHVRDSIVAVLSLQSIEVVSFARGDEFIEHVNSGAAFDAAVIDVTLPDMTGWELRDWLREAGYSQPAVVCSGKAL